MNDAPASAMNTGTPAIRIAMKMNAMTTIVAFSIRVNLVGDVVRPAPAGARIAPDVLDLAQQHQEAAEADARVDPAHRQIEHRHALDAHALDDGDRQVGEQSDEGELDE